MLRSETMSYYSILFSKENAYEILEELGHLGILDIEDLNNDLISNKKNYFSQISEIHLALKRFEEIEKLMTENGMITSKEIEESYKTTLVLSKLKTDLKKTPYSEFYHHLYEDIENRFNNIIESNKDLKKMEEKVFQSSDCINVLESLRDNLPKNFSKINPFSKNEFKKKSLIRLEYVIGVISNYDLYNFQKSLFRLSRGNVFVNYFPVKKHHFLDQKKKIEKTVVFLTFQNTESKILSEKISTLCRSFRVTIYPMPDSLNSIEIDIAKKYNENNEINQILEKSINNIKENLNYYYKDFNFINISRLYEERVYLLKQLNIYETMNKFNIRKNFFEGRFWIPVCKEKYFEDALSYLVKQKEFNGFRTTSLDFKNFKKQPPTLISTNSFSAPFQNIVDTYGVPNYKEINPGLFTIVTFPFLFGVMFGDIGHGLMLFIFGLFLFFYENKFPKDIRNLKCLLVFMGFFACYCGIIYNDFFAVPVPLMNSCYEEVDGGFGREENCNYPIGIDYTWHHTHNTVSFINSFKMKLSIVIGVIHMLVGISMKGLNALYFSHLAEFFFDFLPQMLFMLSTFGYMVVCIIAKWLIDYSEIPGEAPSIIALYINFIGEVKQPLIGTAQFQEDLQGILATIAAICVPIMLLGKPLTLALFAKKEKGYQPLNESIDLEDIQEKSNLIQAEFNQTEQSFDPNSNPSSNSNINKKEDHSHDFSEMLIHQSIETIEFVLGSISNTASYLRLWALSLAHSQLAKVFFEMLLKPYISGHNSIGFDVVMACIMFVMFIIVTFAVLMIMDLMECFLHALRLHWVEFQNKFYKGEGYKFNPLNFAEYISSNFE